MLRSSATSLLFLVAGSYALCANQVAGEESDSRAQTKSQNLGGLTFDVPAKLPPVRFGEPVYLPISICNHEDEPKSVSSFRNHRPWLTYVVRSGSETNECMFYGANGGDSHSLPPRSVETTVLLINIWSPGIALEFLKTQSVTIDLQLPHIGDINRLELAATTQVDLSNADSPFPESQTAFGNHDAIFNIAYNCFSPAFRDSRANYLELGNAHTNAFCKGQSPLNWLDFNQENVDSWHATSDFYKKAKSMVAKDSALFRMMTFTELRDEMRGANPVSERSTLETLNAYFKLLDKCQPSERHFHIVALNAIGDLTAYPDAVREPDMNWDELRSEIVKWLPMYRMYFTTRLYDLPFSSVSMLDGSEATSK